MGASLTRPLQTVSSLRFAYDDEHFAAFQRDFSNSQEATLNQGLEIGAPDRGIDPADRWAMTSRDSAVGVKDDVCRLCHICTLVVVDVSVLPMEIS